MKRCPTCHRPAAFSRHHCAHDGAVLVLCGTACGVRNPDEPPPGLGEVTTIGPPPLPPKGPDAGAGLGGGVESNPGASEGRSAGQPAPQGRSQTLMYARSDVAADLPSAAPMLESAPAAAAAAPAPTGGVARTTIPASSGSAVPQGVQAARPPSEKHAAAKAKPAAAAVPAEERPTLVTSMESAPDLDDSEAERSAYVGKLIDDRYMVKALLGRGGMGAVYRVEQIHLRKDMAIKLLHENLVARKQLVSRFTREARAISRLSSPHTVMVYDFGRWGEVFYLVMELLEGEALDGMLEREGPLDAERTTAILLQMCDSLQEAHDHGIVHRDLKPENVMLLREGAHPDFVKILDFGLAKVEDVDDPYTIHSQKDIFGTPFYMSPEQIRAGDVDGRSDLYAIGALTFRMLTGKQVFGHERSTFDILKAHLMETPPRMNDVVGGGRKIPEALEAIVARCLEKEPNSRFANMRALADALVEARKGNFEGRAPVKAEPAPAPVVNAASPYEDRPSATTESRLADDDEALGRHVRQGRLARAAGFFLAAALLVGGVSYLLMQPSGQGGEVEAEPNDLPGKANPLGPGNQVRGSIGKRLSATAGDRDCFVLPAGQDDDLAVSISRVPNMDLEIALYDAGGKELARYDHRGPDQGEAIAHADTARRPSVVCVGEKVAAGRTPSESLSDTYTLTVKRTSRNGPLEREPNDLQPVEPIPPGLSLLGALDGPRDVDIYKLGERVDGKIVRIHLESADNKPLGGLRIALLDSNGRPMASEVFRPEQTAGELALAVSGTAPERVSLRWLGDTNASWPQDGSRSGTYKLWTTVEALSDQPEREPNNTPQSATQLVVGAWHVGDVNDAAAIDWLRVDGGDEALRKIRLDVGVPPGSGVKLTVQDPVAMVDVREVLVLESANDQELLVDGRGAGFLLRLERLPADKARKGRPLDGRYRLRVRWAGPGSDLPRLELP